MFRLISLALAFGLAVCQPSPRGIDTFYVEGREYVYEYESQVMSGLPEGGKTWAGLKLQSQVLIQPTSHWKFKLQLTSPRLYKINDLIDSKDPTKEMLPSEMFKELLDDDAEFMKEELRKPVTVSYVRGHIEDLVTEEDDPTWSVDMKRGILSLLELNFNERQSLDRDISPTSPHDEPTVYRVIEPSLAGECETTYKVIFERSDRDEPSMKLEKIRNLNKCLEKVVNVKGLLDGQPCEICDAPEVSDPLSAQASVKYSLLGSPDKFVILSARAESQYHVLPFSETKGKMSTLSNQTLTLIDSRPISDQIMDHHSPLSHERPLKVKTTPYKDPLAPSKMDMKPKETEEVFQKVMKVLRGMEILMKNKVEEESGDLMYELTWLLKKLDKQALNKLMDDIFKDDVKFPKARKVLLDMLPTLGTYPSVDVLLERIEKGYIPKDSATVIFMTLGLLPQPDVFTVKRLMDFVENKEIKSSIEDKLFRRSVWLSLGSLGNKMIKSSKESYKVLKSQEKIVSQLRDEANDKSVRRSLDKKLEEIKNKQKQIEEMYNTEKQQIVELVKKLSSKEDFDSKLLAIKVCGGLGFKELFPSLHFIITDKMSPMLHRLEAVSSLQKMHKEVPDKVQKLLVPLVLDRREPEEVRSLAFVTLLWTKPSDSDLQMIAKSLDDEPSVNVGSLIYSSLLDLSNMTTTCTCVKSMSRNSTLALRFGRKSHDSPQKSTFTFKSSYSKKLGMGHSYTQVMIHSFKERSPRAMGFKYSTTFFGRYIDFVEVGMKAKGLDSVLDDMLESSTGTDMDTILKTVLHPRTKRSFKPSDETIKEIKEKLGVRPRVSQKPDGHVFMKLFGQELMYLDFNSLMDVSYEESKKTSLIERLKEKNGILETLQKLLKSQKSYSLPLLHSVIPTETGLPLKFSLDKQGTFIMDGDFDVKSAFSTLTTKSLISKMDATLNLKPSGLMEFRGRVEVDMKYIKSGVEVKCQALMDMPVTMDLNMDPDKSKFLVKVRDQDMTRPMKMESRVHTVIWRDPSKAFDFPVPPEKMEISVIDGAELQVFSREYGQDLLGRKVTMSGEFSVRKDESVPFIPLSGRQVLKFQYEPVKTSYFLIQMQHIREMNEKFEPDSDSESESGSWWPLSWLTSSNGDTSRPDSSRSDSRYDDHDSSSSSKPWHSPDAGFLDLEKTDLSVMYLKEKFTQDTRLLESGVKCGLVVRVADPAFSPDRQVQLSTLYQRDTSGKKVSYTMELRRSPRPEERMPWRMVADMKMDIPERDVKPSDLFDNEYQRSIQKQIKLSITENGEQVDALLDLRSDIITKASKQLKKILQPDRLDKIIEDVISHVMQKSVNEHSKPLKDLVQMQRKLEMDIEKKIKTPTEPWKSVSEFESLKLKLETSMSILEEVSNKLDMTPPSEQNAEDSVMVLYILSSQVKSERKLRKISDKFQPVLPVPEMKSIQIKLEEYEKRLKDIRMKQRKQSVDKQKSEQQKSTLEIEPNERDLHTDLLKIEKKLISLAEMKVSSTEQSPVKELDQKQIVLDVSSDLESLRSKLDDKLLAEPKLDKMLRVKILEVLLRQKLCAQDIKKHIKKMEMEEKIRAISSPRSWRDGTPEENQKDLVMQKDNLKTLAKSIAERLVLSINEEKETHSLISEFYPEDKDRMTELLKVEVKQLDIIDKVTKKDSYKSKDPKKKEPTKESLQEVVDKIKETNQKLKEITEKEKVQKDDGTLLCPVLVKSLKTLTKQSEILEKVEQIIKDRIKRKAVTEDPDIQVYKKMKEDVHKSKDEVKKILEKTREIKKKEMNSETFERKEEDSRQRWDETPSRRLHSSPDRPDQPSSVVVILKMAHKVESKQLELKSVIDKLEESMEKSWPLDAHSKATQLVKQKEILYDVISKLLQSQSELDKIQDSLMDTVMARPVDDSVKDLVHVISDKQKTQEKLVKTVEKKLVDRSRSDLALMQPLQKVQQLKDKILRQKHDVDIIKDQLEEKSHQQSDDPSYRRASVRSPPSHDVPSRYRSDVPSRYRSDIPSRYRVDQEEWPLPRDLTGLVKIKYGVQDGRDKVISIRIFGKKSLEQLLWESDQKLPTKQDKLVEKYLMDKLERDDITSPEYHKLKHELNTYRHFHVLVAYENSIPVEIRSWFWKSQEFMKFMYSSKLSLVMPDHTNLPNRLEMIMEIRKDYRWTDVEIKTPSETNIYKNLRTPEMVWDMSLSDSLEEAVLSTVSSRHRPASCHISQHRIKTFKGKTFKVEVKPDECKKVLLMDCSPSSSMAITSKPLPQQPEKKLITVFTKDMKIEMIPDPSRPRHVQVKVDDKEVLVSSQPITVKETEKKMPVKVKKFPDDNVEVMIPHLGISVKSDGSKISIKVPQTYWSKLCGVCGSLDGDMSSPLEGPHGTTYTEPSPYLSTYLIPDSQCYPDSVQKLHRVPEIRKKSKLLKPVEETKVKTLTQNGIPKTCFSIIPVKQCPPNSQPDSSTSKLVPYHCLRTSSPTTKQYLDIVQRRILDEIRDKTPDYNENITMPEFCKVY